MKTPINPLAAFAVMALVVLGLPLGLYVLFTRGRRRSMREIRTGAEGRGWKFRMRRWAGNPTSFRIEGRTPGGLDWILKTIGAGTETYSPGWNAELDLLFPMLAGKVDFAMFPREASDRRSVLLAAGLPPGTQARVASLSPALGSALEFFRDAAEVPTGLPEFDASYRVLAQSPQFRQALDNDLVGRVLHWPQDAIAPLAVLAWRDPFGLHLKIRLPAPANWPTVTHAVAVAEQFASRIGGGSMPFAPPSFVDRLIARFES